ncbi:UNVERIFIED_CONTAM: hypothetical protein NCL1_29891 [Trichonephila clavipes]
MVVRIKTPGSWVVWVEHNLVCIPPSGVSTRMGVGGSIPSLQREYPWIFRLCVFLEYISLPYIKQFMYSPDLTTVLDISTGHQR